MPDPDNRGAARDDPVRISALYLVIDGKAEGPFDNDAVAALIKTGKILAGTLVWREGMTEWAPLKEVKALKSVLDQVYQYRDGVALAFLLGAWNSEPAYKTLENYGRAVVAENMVLSADGSFSGIDVWRGLDKMRPLSLSEIYEGTYKVERADDGAFVVLFTGKRTTHESGVKKADVDPKFEMGLWFDRVDANTMRNRDDGVVHHRAQ